MTRVLFVNYSNLLGGAERSLLDLMSALPRDRFLPALMTVGEGPLSARARASGIGVLSVYSKIDFEPFRRDALLRAIPRGLFLLPRFLRLLIRVRVAVRGFAPHVLHSNNPKSHVLASLATAAIPLRRVFHFRDIFPANGPAWHLFNLLGRFFRPEVAAISRAVREALPPSLRERSRVLYNGFPLPPGPPDSGVVRAELALPAYATVILTAGRLAPWKRFERVILALETPLLKGDCFLIIAGTPEYWDEGYETSLKTLVREKGLEHRVRFAGHVADMNALYFASDCFALASDQEPFGRVLVEAMLCGLPVVALNEAGPAEIVAHGKTGLLCPPGDPAALEKTLARILWDPDLRKRLGAAARTEAAGRFSIGRLSAAIESLYESNPRIRPVKTSNRLFKTADTLFGLLLLPFQVFRIVFPKHNRSKAPDNILVCKLCCFGDGVLSLLALTALRKRHPPARITVIASQRTQALFERCEAVHRVLILPVSGVRGRSELLTVFRLPGFFLSIVRGRYDTLLDFDVYYRFTTALALFTGSDYSAGFDTVPGRGRLYGLRVVRPWNEPEWRLFFAMVAPLGVEVDESVRPRFRATASDRSAAADLLLPAPAGALRVGLVHGSSANWPEKEWPAAHFAEFMHLFGLKRKTHFFLLGTTEELTRSGELVKLYGEPEVTDLTGRTPFGLLIEVVKSLDLVVSNDTGPMHLASILGVPTLGLFGPSTETKWTPPGPFRALYSDDCPRRPCYYLSRMPVCTDRRCLTGLTPERVAGAALEMLEGKAP